MDNVGVQNQLDKLKVNKSRIFKGFTAARQIFDNLVENYIIEQECLLCNEDFL